MDSGIFKIGFGLYLRRIIYIKGKCTLTGVIQTMLNCYKILRLVIRLLFMIEYIVNKMSNQAEINHLRSNGSKPSSLLIPFWKEEEAV